VKLIWIIWDTFYFNILVVGAGAAFLWVCLREGAGSNRKSLNHTIWQFIKYIPEGSIAD
jgi:hypothetical protein